MEKDALQVFLETLLSPVGAGVFLWGAVAFIIKAIPFLDEHQDAKFWLAFVFALIIPPAAFAAQVGLGYATFTPDAMFTSIGVAFMTSQGVHRATKKVGEKVAERAYEKAVEARMEHHPLEPSGTPINVSIPQGHLPYIAPIAPAGAPSFLEDERSGYEGDSGDEQREGGK